MRSIWMIGVIVTFGLVTGCAAAEAPYEPPSGRGMSISLPLDAYSPAPAEQERADRAQAALERDCLSRFGMTWPGPGETALLEGGERIAAKRAERFGLVDGDLAARYGYHPPPWNSKAGGRKAEHHEQEQPPGEVGSVLFGQVAELGGKPVPSGGCRGEAFRRLSAGADQLEGVTAADSALLPRLVSQSAQRVAADPRISALSSAWSACMARAGRRFATPEDAARDKRWKPGGKPSKEETATAIADVRCKDEVGYLETFVTVAAEDQRALIEQHAVELGLIARLRAVKTENVARALGQVPERG